MKGKHGEQVLIAGAGIGGLTAALALSQCGYRVKILEQATALGEIGAGIQLGPNAFTALDALGIGEAARARAVSVDQLIMRDLVDDSLVLEIPTAEAFRERFGNPYAVIHRAVLHDLLVREARACASIEILTSTRVCSFEQDETGVTAIDEAGARHAGAALVAADGVKSCIRAQLVGDKPRVSGHVVYRAVVEREKFPADLQWDLMCVWVGPGCHMVHYPVNGGESFNLVVTFQSHNTEELSVRKGSREEVHSYFTDICPRARPLIELPKDWTRWATADRQPIERWSHDRVTLLGDAAHPCLQYMAQGACMAIEDSVVLGECLRKTPGDFPAAFSLYEKSRVVRTARIVLSAREMGRIFHASGVERLVRNDMWRNRTPEQTYDAIQWLYGWSADQCIIQ